MKIITNARNTNQKMVLDVHYDTMYRIIDKFGGLWKVEDGDYIEWAFPGGHIPESRGGKITRGGWWKIAD